MHVFRSALSACVMKNLQDVEYFMPLDRDRLSEEGRKNIERNNRSAVNTNGNNDSEDQDAENQSIVTYRTNQPRLNFTLENLVEEEAAWVTEGNEDEE